MSVLRELAAGGLLGASVYVMAQGLRAGREWLASSGCICHRHGWNPDCPVHGRRLW